MCFPAPSPHPCLTQQWPADRASLPSAEKRAGVFHLQAPSGPYGLNFSEAEAACGAQGAVLASLLQLSAAQQVYGAWESGAKPVGTLFSWALGLSLCLSCYSWASTSALWAGWPTARLPTPSSSLRQTAGMARWAWSAWAPGRTARSAGTPTASACKVWPPPQARSLLCLSLLTHSLAVLPSLQTWPADAAMVSWVMGPACAMGSCWMYWPPLPTSPPSMGYPGARGVVRRGSLWREPTHNPVSHHLQMLLGYANATPRGLEFLDFLDDEHTYKTLFVPVNEGFVDNMVTRSVGRAGPGSAFCGWSTTTAVLCPQTLSGPDLELHASNTTFLSTNASQGALLPAHSGLSLVISDLGPGNSSQAPEASLAVAPALLAQPSLLPLGLTPVSLQVPGAVVVSRVIVWDILAFNGIIHTLASPLLAPPQSVS